MEDETGGLLNIDIASDDEATTDYKKVPRDFQSEGNFQSVKAGYIAKIENGELWQTLSLPINNPTKAECQSIMHAIEELYFSKRYKEASQFTEKALKGILADDFLCILENYHRKCEAKVIAALA